MIDVIDLKKDFGDTQVLKGVSVKINKGDIVVVLGAHEHSCAQILQCACIAGMVRVQMSEENISVCRGNAQLLQPLHKHIKALGPVEAGVDQQMAAAVFCLDNVGVKAFQRISRQGNENLIYVFINLFYLKYSKL